MFRNLKIAPKLIACFMLVVCIASISGIIGSLLLIKMDTDYSKALVENGFSQGEIGSFNTYLNKGGAVVRDIVLLTNASEIAASEKELNTIADQTTKALEALRPNCQTPEEKKIIESIDANLPKYRELRDRVIVMGKQNLNDEALTLFHSTARPILNELMSSAEELADLNVAMGNTVSADLTKNSRLIIGFIIFLIIASVAASIVFAVVISKSIANPIIKVKDAAAQLARGDLQIEIEAQSNDEVGEMTQSFSHASELIRRYIADIDHGLSEVAKGNFDIEPREAFIGDFKKIENSIYTITTSLSGAMGQINQSSDQVSSGSEQVSSGAQALSQGATEQASSVEELAATISDISNQVKSTAANAQDAKVQARSAGDEVQNCNRQMQEMIVAITDISQKSSEIGKIIKTIEDIAFQTNILALNAAVEAARAGAAGKGFAVVADEVRNLASKSAEAAKNTTALIEGSIRAVENGNRLADETANSLLSVVDSTSSVAKTIDKISDAANEQATSIAQVTLGIDQISSVVQTNSATAEESAAASEELNAQAQTLKTLVGNFKLRNEPHAVYLEKNHSNSQPLEPSSYAEPAPLYQAEHHTEYHSSAGGKY